MFMSLCARILCLASAVLLVAVPNACAQQSKEDRPGQAKPMVVRRQMPALPGFWQLRQEHVRKDLELVPEQIEKLEKLGKEFAEEQRKDYASYRDWGNLSQEERQAKYKELQERRRERNKEYVEKVEKVLLPHQLEALSEINLRTVGYHMLYQPRIIEAVGITKEQQAKIKQIREEWMEKQKEMHKEMMEKQLSVLSKEQVQKLKEQLKTRGY